MGDIIELPTSAAMRNLGSLIKKAVSEMEDDLGPDGYREIENDDAAWEKAVNKKLEGRTEWIARSLLIDALRQEIETLIEEEWDSV
ncbi:MAG: hypothetical protein RIA64_01575 [Rhodospirillales bacterium]